MQKKRVAIYVRVSTLEQAEEGHSISEQTERLKKYCEARDWVVVMVYTDPGFSGSNVNRPSLSRMLEDIQDNQIDIVLVYKLDRLSRSQKDTLYLIEDVFLKNNTEFVSMNENFDTTTPFGRAMIGILSVFAQLEREQIKERMAMGHIGRAKEGYWHGGGNSPIGYDFVDGKLVINEYEAMQVREIYDLFIKGEPIHGICKIMKEKYTNRYSSWNGHSTVGIILKNPTYMGQIYYKEEEYTGQHEAIVSNDIFTAAQLRHAEIEKSKTGSQKTPYKAKHLLSGMMFCGNCGARYFTQCIVSKKHGTYHYYKCYSRDGNKEMKKIDGCKNPNYREDVLDNIIINEIVDLSFDKSKIEKLYKKHRVEPSDRSSTINNRIVEIGKQLNKLLDLYQLGTVSIENIGKRIEPLQEEKKKLETELKKDKPSLPILSVDEAYELTCSSHEVFESGTNSDKRRLVNSLIKKIVIYQEEIKIYWKFC